MLSKKLIFVIALVGFSLNLPTVFKTSQSVYAQSGTSFAPIRAVACDCGRPSCIICSGSEPTAALAPTSRAYGSDSSHLAPVPLQYDAYSPAIPEVFEGSGCGCDATSITPNYGIYDASSLLDGGCQTGGCQTGGCETGGCQTGGCQKQGCRHCRTARAPRQRSCRKCPKCLNDVCTLKVEKGKEKKSYFETEQKIICVPKVRFPWQNCNPDNPAPTCSKTRTVTLLKKGSYECDVCKYSWNVVEPAVPDVSHLQDPADAPASGDVEAGSVQPDGTLPFENDGSGGEGSENGPQKPIVPDTVPQAPPVPKTSGLFRFKPFR